MLGTVLEVYVLVLTFQVYNHEKRFKTWVSSLYLSICQILELLRLAMQQSEATGLP